MFHGKKIQYNLRLPYEDNAEGMIAAFGRMQKYHKAINAGELFIGSCTTPDALDGSVQQKTIEFTRKIVE